MRSSRLLAMVAIAAMGNMAARIGAGAADVMRGARPLPTRPDRVSTGLPGMGHGTKVRGNRAVRRASVKARNVQRHRALCRG